MNKTILITGAAKRIGREMAKAFFDRGWDIVIHFNNSIEDALEDERVLPFGSNEDWFSIANENSFQYPYSGAGTLEENKVYGWQIKVEMPTTSGAEEMLSSAFAFKIGALLS